ncbi:hypothetical protein [Lyngbya sp. PCC 8106]|nr:hypothetical protein [Lyngbya sp. PCC 8106]EAW37854.1 hypothetical protein L8106_05505 [Lyngbya sp. PCC 8106]
MSSHCYTIFLELIWTWEASPKQAPPIRGVPMTFLSPSPEMRE